MGVPEDKVLWNMTREELLKEIVERRKLIDGMVGWLYPSILWDEIAKIGIVYAAKVGRPI